MPLTLLIISAIFCAVVFIADVHSSEKFDEYPEISEGTKMFRNKDGDTNVPKLILFKAGLFAGAAIGSIVVYNLDGGANFAFVVFLVMAAVEFLTVRNNYALIKKAKAKRAAN